MIVQDQDAVGLATPELLADKDFMHILCRVDGQQFVRASARLRGAPCGECANCQLQAELANWGAGGLQQMGNELAADKKLKLRDLKMRAEQLALDAPHRPTRDNAWIPRAVDEKTGEPLRFDQALDKVP